MNKQIYVTIDFDNDKVRIQNGSNHPIECKIRNLADTHKMLVELFHILNAPNTILAIQNEGECKTIAEW